jgi:hypothetical protein
VLLRERTRNLPARLRGNDRRLVFVVGAPRSGTTFLARSIGSLPGFADLTEVTPLKAAIPGLVCLSDAETATTIHGIMERVRALALVRGVRGVEQTPETAFVIGAALRAYPEAVAVHIVRDGRDVVCSLLERGWLSAGRAGLDDAGATYGAGARFWVEPSRRAEFAAASDAARAAWAWREYVRAALAVRDRVLVVSYETLPDAAPLLADHLGVDETAMTSALAGFVGGSIGRHHRDLTSDQLADVWDVAGGLLRELGYAEPDAAEA